MPSKQTQPASLEFSRMLFLVGHGLQTPLSAIRWGCSRLKKLFKDPTDEQREVLEGVQREARLLSKMVDWLLLVAKLEDGQQAANVQEVFLYDFLQTAVADRQEVLPMISVVCPEDLQIQTDRTVFEAIVQALILALSVDEPAASASLTASEQNGHCVLTLDAPLTLTLLRQEAGNDAKPSQVVGGVRGVLLSIASSLAETSGGSLATERESHELRRVILRIPMHPSLTSLLS